MVLGNLTLPVKGAGRFARCDLRTTIYKMEDTKMSSIKPLLLCVSLDDICDLKQVALTFVTP